MGLLAWVALFLACSLFWGWLVFGGGADWLEGSFLAGLVVHVRATAWTAEGIKAFAVLMWLCQAIWFVIGLFSREARLVGL
ncbi:hypothetical protein [Gemmata sp.]|uniref:hypothetical protein n=1 Tax=Gemmata sp. TaxID=1914242 RepID=UPI003F6ED1B2